MTIDRKLDLKCSYNPLFFFFNIINSTFHRGLITFQRLHSWWVALTLPSVNSHFSWLQPQLLIGDPPFPTFMGSGWVSIQTWSVKEPQWLIQG